MKLFKVLLTGTILMTNIAKAYSFKELACRSLSTPNGSSQIHIIKYSIEKLEKFNLNFVSTQLIAFDAKSSEKIWEGEKTVKQAQITSTQNHLIMDFENQRHQFIIENENNQIFQLFKSTNVSKHAPFVVSNQEQKMECTSNLKKLKHVLDLEYGDIIDL